MTELLISTAEHEVKAVLKRWGKKPVTVDDVVKEVGTTPDRIIAITLGHQVGLNPKEIAKRLNYISPTDTDAIKILDDLDF